MSDSKCTDASSVNLPNAVKKLLNEPNFAFMATLMPDGSPQLTPTWVDIEENTILINTAEGRQKPRNIKRDPRVAIVVSPSNNPYAYASIRGTVIEITREGADSHANKLAKKYLGKDHFPFNKPGEHRIIIKINPSKISTLRID